MVTLSYYGAPLAYVDYELADLVSLVVSQDSSCRYCYGMQRTVMRVHGVSEARIRQIEQNFLEAEIDPRTKRGARVRAAHRRARRRCGLGRGPAGARRLGLQRSARSASSPSRPPTPCS